MNRKKSKFILKSAHLFFIALLWLSCGDKTEEIVSAEEFNSTTNVIAKIQEESTNQILVCAHRGFHKNAPENSLEAIQKAIEADIDIVEVDINTTQDGVLVLMHDDKIDRTTNGNGYVSEYTFLELKEFFLKINDSVTNHKIPTLNEAIEVAGDNVILNIDIKRVEVAKLVQQLRSRNREHEVFSFIWDKDKIDEILAIDSLYAVLPLVSSKEEMMNYAQNIPSKLQHFDEQSFNLENMNWAKSNDILVFMNSLWEIDEDFIQNQFDELDEIIELRPAIIQTDHPKILIEYLRSKNLHD
jgi:glycerophosphoryl diester phosphodiesterase